MDFQLDGTDIHQRVNHSDGRGIMVEIVSFNDISSAPKRYLFQSAEPDQLCIHHFGRHCGCAVSSIGKVDDKDVILWNPGCDDIVGSSKDCEVKTNRPSLRHRLRVVNEHFACSEQPKAKKELSNARGRIHKERNGTDKVGKERIEGRKKDSSAEAGVTSSLLNNRSAGTSNPEYQRLYQSEGVQKGLQRKSPSRRRTERKVEERKENEVEENSEEPDGCARTDIIYKRSERSHKRPKPPSPPSSPKAESKVIRYETKEGKVRRSQRLEEAKPKLQLFLWPSRIHGKGVFTKRYIERNQKILEFVGELIRPAISDLREKKNEAKDMKSCYMVKGPEGMVIDITEKGAIGRFVNHCCSPNCEMRRENEKLVLYALRGIEKDEEITMDYGSGDGGRKCNCGDTNCRGILSV